jgi:hypothetical protein
VGTIDKRQRELIKALKLEYPDKIIHIPVWVNKAIPLGREHTQRTRSFLYSALGMIVAESTGSNGIRFLKTAWSA